MTDERPGNTPIVHSGSSGGSVASQPAASAAQPALAEHHSKSVPHVETGGQSATQPQHVNGAFGIHVEFSLTALLMPLFKVAAIAMLVGVAVFFVRGWVLDLLQMSQDNKEVHVPKRELSIQTPPLARKVVKIFIKSDQDGQIHSYVINEGLYSAFQEEQMNFILAERRKALDETTSILDSELKTVTDPMMSGVEKFADWYFGWGTSYKLLFAGAEAYVKALSPNSLMPARQAASHAVGDIVEKQFVDIVLQPEMNDHQVEKALGRAVERLNASYLRTYTVVDRNLNEFVRKNVPFGIPGETTDSVNVMKSLEWSEEAKKLKGVLASNDKGGLSTFGRLAGSAAVGGFAVVGRAMLLGAAKKTLAALTTKLVAPMVMKIAAAVGTGTIAGTAAAAASGPLAPLTAPALFLAGAGITVATDYGLNEVVSAMSRDVFIIETKGVVNSMRVQWVDTFRPELRQYGEVIYDNFLNQLASSKP